MAELKVEWDKETLSAYLLIIMREILCSSIRNSKDIRGIN